jgi:hypothetical protein
LGANMRGQSWYIILLIGLMCLIRFSMSAVGYVDPRWLMTQLNIPIDANIQMPYVIRVWAIRDIVLAIVVAIADRQTVRALLLACITIDTTDVVSAHLSGVAGLFSAAETRSLQLAAIAALIPETIALAVLVFSKTSAQIKVSKN